jgi:hypothetical protein
MIQERTNEKANYIFGILDDDSMKDEIMVTVIATGFSNVIEEASNIRELAEYEPEGKVRNSGKIEQIPTTVEEYRDLDIPAVKRRFGERALLIDDDMNEISKAKKSDKNTNIEYDDFNVDEEYNTPAFLRRQAD